MENALLEAREVNRLLTTPEGRKELLAKTPTGTENLTEAAKKVAEQEQLKGIDNSSRLLPEENKNAPKIQKPNGIPNNWIEKPTRKGGGVVTRTQRTPMIS